MSTPPWTRRLVPAPRPIAGWALVAALAMALLGPLGLATAGQTADSELVAQGADQLRGSQLYSLHCAACHGSDGSGGERDGVSSPELRTISPALLDLVLRTQRMPPGDPQGRTPGNIAYDDADRQALVTYLTERFDLTGDLPEAADGDAARGREVFATNCAACHGSTGAGGVAGGGALTPRVIGADPVTVAAAIREGPFRMPRFSADQIPDRETADVAAFLAEVDEEPATPLGLTELNPVYASGFVLVLALVLIVGLKLVAGPPTYFPDPTGSGGDEPPPPAHDDSAGDEPDATDPGTAP